MKRCVLLLTAFLLSFSAPNLAADKENKFAAKGAGRKSCSDFLTSAQQKNTDYYLYGGWLEGYFSAYNQFQRENYDISPWQTTELLLLLLQRHCQDNPKAKYLDAANAMIKAFYPIRLTEESKIIKIEVGEVSSYFYQEILLRAKQRLKFLGYYEGEPDGATYTDEDTKAFSAYQKKVGLRVTGIPDQRTLTNLFLKATQ